MPKHVLSRRALVAGAAGALVLGAGLLPSAAASPPSAGPAGPATEAAAQAGRNGWVTSTLRRMTLEEKVGQLFIQNVYGKDATTPDAAQHPALRRRQPGRGRAEVPPRRRHLLRLDGQRAGPARRSPGLSNGLQRAALSQDSKVRVPLQVSTDQEQGVVTRIGPPATQFPGSMALGAGRSTADARRPRAHHRPGAAGHGRQHQLRARRRRQRQPGSTRSSARGPSRPTRSSPPTWWPPRSRGYERRDGVSASAKHFPGHGDTATDSHVAFPVITHSRQQWEQLDAPPFKAAIAEGIDMIMTAHLSFPALDDSGDPATLSKPIMTGLLREELGYDGVIVTDSLDMQGVRDLYGDAEVAVRALEAGVDQLLMTPAMDDAYAAVIGAVRSGRISEADARRQGPPGPRAQVRPRHRGPALRRPRPRSTAWSARPSTSPTADAVTDRTTTLVKNDDGTLPMDPSGKKVLVTGYGVTTTQILADGLAAKGGDDDGAARRAPHPPTRPIAARGRRGPGQGRRRRDDDEGLGHRGHRPAGRAAEARQGRCSPPASRSSSSRRATPTTSPTSPSAPTYLATYSYSPVAIESVVRGHHRRGRADRASCPSTSRWRATRRPSCTPSATA